MYAYYICMHTLYIYICTYKLIQYNVYQVLVLQDLMV